MTELTEKEQLQAWEEDLQQRSVDLSKREEAVAVREELSDVKKLRKRLFERSKAQQEFQQDYKILCMRYKELEDHTRKLLRANIRHEQQSSEIYGQVDQPVSAAKWVPVAESNILNLLSVLQRLTEAGVVITPEEEEKVKEAKDLVSHRKDSEVDSSPTVPLENLSTYTVDSSSLTPSDSSSTAVEELS